MQGLLGQLDGTHAMPLGRTNGQGLLAPVLQLMMQRASGGGVAQQPREVSPQAALELARMFGLLDPSQYEGRR
jgi:hypothetical protein